MLMMEHLFTRNGLRLLTVSLFLLSQLTACGGGSNDSVKTVKATAGSNRLASSQPESSAPAEKSESSNKDVVPSTQPESSAPAQKNESSDKGVVPSANTGNLSLKWSAPVARTDGTPLSLADIDGFRIYYGTSPREYTHHVDVADGTSQSVTLKKIPVGTYYLAMTTYDNSGRESGYSAEIAKDVL